MTIFELYALAAPLIAFAFLACFAALLVRRDQAAYLQSHSDVTPTQVKEAAE